MSVFLLTSQRNAMRALASQGIFATDCHAQVCSIIAQHLSPAHAALIAEPQHDPGQQRIDWYAGVNGTATPVSALPTEEAERLRARAGELARDILHLSEQWGKDAQSRERPLPARCSPWSCNTPMTTISGPWTASPSW